MKGFELAEVREAILGAYDKRTFDRLLSDQFDLRREDIAGDGPLRNIVDDVLRHFVREGREAHLIAELAADRPAKPEIQAVYTKYAAALVSDAWRSRIEAESATQLDRYGLLPEGRLQHRGATLRPRGPSEPDASAFGGFQKQIHARLPELDVFEWSSRLMRQTYRVCRVEVRGTPLGTGFLVGPATVLTCYHVVGDAIRARTPGSELTFLFDYWKKLNGAESYGIRVAARGAWEDWHVDSSPPLPEAEEHGGVPEATDDQLDHALIALAQPLGAGPIVDGGPVRGWIEVPATAPTLTLEMAIAILHHPRNGPIKLTFDTSALQHINPGRTRIRYSTNTDSGSSGSPCFDVSLGLIGMHHFSDPHNKVPAYNQGIPIDAIRRRLARVNRLDALGVTDSVGAPALPAGFEAHPAPRRPAAPMASADRPPPLPTAKADASYDLFLAYSPDDRASASSLYSLLQGYVRVFLDERSLRPGDRRDKQIPAAQRTARATAILLSSVTDPDWYRGHQIATAVELNRAAPPAHLLVLVLLDPKVPVPSGLGHLQAINVAAEGGLAGIAARLREVVARAPGQSAPAPAAPVARSGGAQSAAAGDGGGGGAGRGGPDGCDHVRLHERLTRLTDALFEEILLHARIERRLIPARSAALAERTLELANLAAVDPGLCRRVAALLDQRAPWTR